MRKNKWKKKVKFNIKKKREKKDTPTNPVWLHNFFLKQKQNWKKIRDKSKSRYLISQYG
jgi:hypothetical protein